MHDVTFGQNCEGLQQIPQIMECLSLFYFPVLADLLLECASIAVLIDEVVVISCFEDLDEPHHMGGVLDFGQSLDLVDGELFELGTGLEFLYADYLDGNCLQRLLVHCAVDLAELTLTHHVLQHVVLDLLTHCCQMFNYINNQHKTQEHSQKQLEGKDEEMKKEMKKNLMGEGKFLENMDLIFSGVAYIYMFLINKLRRPLLPVLMITTSLDQQRAGNLIAKCQKLNYARCKAIGLVIEIDNYMPVQIEKIRNLLMHIQSSHKLPLYGFCQSKVSAQSFYLLSICDHLYASPSSIFEFHSHQTVLDTTGLLSSLGIERFMVKSNPELSEIGCSLQGNTAQVNLIRKEIKESLISQSVKTISSRKKGELIGQTGEFAQQQRLLSLIQSQTHLLGHEAAELGLVEGIEQYYEALHRLYPTCQIRHVRLKDKMSTRLVQFFVASPIVLIIVLIKMLVKYSILMYIYLKHSQKK